MLLLLSAAVRLSANVPTYLLEFGVQGGTSYYVGDLHEHIFMCPRYAAGAHVSYKFNRRWILTAKSEFSDIAFKTASGLADNFLLNTDVTVEYNFFRFDVRQYDPRIKPITPYIAVGVGFGLFGRDDADSKYLYNSAMYIPFVLGLKWKLSPRWAVKIAWQHQLYMLGDADRLENNDNYNNTYELNKANILRNDLASSLTISISCSFAKKREKCMLCRDENKNINRYSDFSGRIALDEKPRKVKGAHRKGRIMAD